MVPSLTNLLTCFILFSYVSQIGSIGVVGSAAVSRIRAAQHPVFHRWRGGKLGSETRQVYTTLARLEKSGLVRQAGTDKDSGPEKHIHTITPKGKREVARWFREGVPEDHMHDEFFIKLRIALALEEVDALEIIRIQRNTLYQQLHNVTTQRQNIDLGQDMAQMLMLDKSVMHLETDLRWLEMIEARWDEVANQPISPPANQPRGRPLKARQLND